MRWLALSHHYRSPLDYSDDDAEQARSALQNIYQKFYLLSKSGSRDGEKTNSEDESGKRYQELFSAALADDLNTPKALAVLHQLLDAASLPPKSKLELLWRWNGILGFGMEKALYNAGEEAKIAENLRNYQECRIHQQFAQSDALRKEIEQLGYEVRDTKDGPEIVKKFF